MLRAHVEDELLDLALFDLDRRERVVGRVFEWPPLDIGSGYLSATLHDLFAKPEESFDQGLGARRASGNVDVDGDDRVDALERRVAVPELAARGRAAAQR